MTVTPDQFQPRFHHAVEALVPDDARVLEALGHSGRTYADLERHAYTQGYGIWQRDRLVALAFVMAKTEHVCEICGVYVHPKFRRQGLGSAVVSRAVQHILDHGWTPCYGTRESNFPSQRLAKSLGFWYYQDVDYCVAHKKRKPDGDDQGSNP